MLWWSHLKCCPSRKLGWCLVAIFRIGPYELLHFKRKAGECRLCKGLRRHPRLGSKQYRWRRSSCCWCTQLLSRAFQRATISIYRPSTQLRFFMPTEGATLLLWLSFRFELNRLLLSLYLRSLLSCYQSRPGCSLRVKEPIKPTKPHSSDLSTESIDVDECPISRLICYGLCKQRAASDSMLKNQGKISRLPRICHAGAELTCRIFNHRQTSRRKESLSRFGRRTPSYQKCICGLHWGMRIFIQPSWPRSSGEWHASNQQSEHFRLSFKWLKFN